MSWICSVREATELLRAIAQRLVITRPLVALDIEATGPYPERDRIVELAVLKVLPDGDVREFRTLINPQEPIPSGASEVHGITDDMVHGAPTFREIGPRITVGLDRCDVVAYNARRFDKRILAAECARIGLADPLDQAKVLDPYVIFQRQAPRDLAAAIRQYVDPAADFAGHRAMDDVAATVRVLFEQLASTELPQTVHELHDYCLHRDPSFVDEAGKIVWRGEAAVIAFGKNAGSSLEDLAAQDPGFLQWMLRSDFPSDTKRVISDALNGTYPTKTAAPVAAVERELA